MKKIILVAFIILFTVSGCDKTETRNLDENKSYKKYLTHIDDIIETIAEEKEELAAEKQTPQQDNILGCINANIEHSNRLIQEHSIVKKHKTKIISMRYDVHTGKIIEL